MTVSLSSQAIWRGARASSLNGQASPPRGLMSQSCILAASGLLPGRARLLRKAMDSPSGDHTGWELLSEPRVNWISRLSVRLDKKRFEIRASFSLSPEDLTPTSHLPSGEMWYAPMDSLKMKSSGFQGS